ncbi:putative Ig domain-containing protein [Marixanthomonas spongiae]|uniref:Ig-like domain-containing protein n=1 Tax=Marixanthomonas spongiae TaxID=2174845 RepID=A0A2U0HXL7_9FLAO|nr:putative Ig domain-containing protein [Marixanthomonas spongiae]PVW13576.1 hypothetical protein DDV96_13065 [Marixanthomonas spongiae]
MKFYHTKTLTILLVTLFFISCGLTDDDEAVSSPSLTYPVTNLSAIFFEEGNSQPPTITWNGNQGTISLSSSIEGLSVNSSTGVLNWDKQLNPGDYTFDVIATNSAGQTSVSFNLSNPLQGTFTGTFSGSSFFELEFNSDGTLVVRANADNPDLGSGTWELANDILTADYTYDDTGNEYSISGLLEQSSTQVIYTGNWYYGHGAEEANEADVFEVIME